MSIQEADPKKKAKKKSAKIDSVNVFAEVSEHNKNSNAGPEQLISRHPQASGELVRKAISRAREAQKIWASFEYRERAVFIRRIKHWLKDHSETIARIIADDTGKSRIDAMATEVIPAILACDWYAKNAEKVLRPKKLRPSSVLFSNKKTVLERYPLGVVGIISPWNYPLSIPFGEIVMGLMAGNAILLKGSHDTEQVTKSIGDIISSARLPEGLFQIVDGPGREISEAMFDHKIDKIFFTGSVAVGKSLMKRAADSLTPLSLELGGNDPMVVLEDADLERASNGAIWGAFQNAGQTCAGIERLYVHESIYHEFKDILVKKISMLRHGRDEEFDVDMGSMTTERQFHSVSRQVEDAVKEGAKISAQSKFVRPESGLFYPATLLTEVSHEMEVMKEETFGPVLGMMPFSDEEDAIRLANDSQYALTSSVWTKDTQRGKKIARKLVSGVTTINDHLFTHALSEVPWGGPKLSGLGRTHGSIGLEEMTELKAINWDMMPVPRNVFWHPYSLDTWNALHHAINIITAKSKSDWIVGVCRLAPYYAKKCLKKWKVN